MSGQYGDYAASQGASYHGYGAPGDAMQQNYGAQASDMHGMQQGASYDQYGQGQAGFQGHGGQFGERGLDARAAQEARELQKLQQLQQLGLTGAAGAGGQRQHEAQQMSSEASLQNYYAHQQGGQQGYLGMQQSIQQQPNSANAYQDRGVMQQEQAGYMGMDPQAYQASLQAGNQGHWPSGGPQGGLQPPQAGAGGYPGSSVVFDPTTGMGFLPGGNSAEAPAPGRYGGYDEPGANRMGRGRDPGQMGMENAGAFGRADGSGMPRPQGGGGMGMGMGMGMGPGGGGMHQGRMGDMGMHGARGGPPRDMGMRNGPGGPMGMPSDGDRMHRPAPGMYGGGGMPNRGGGMGPGMGAGAMQGGNNMGGPRGFDRGMDRGGGRRSPPRGRRSRSPPRRRTPPPKRQRSPSPRRQRSPSPKRRRSPRREPRSERSVEDDKKRDRDREGERERSARKEKEKDIPRALGSNVVRVPLLPLTAPVRDYVDLARRYPRMHIPDDFSRAVTWAGLADPGPDAARAPLRADAISALLSRVPGARGEQAGAVAFEHAELAPAPEDTVGKQAGPPPWGPGTKDPAGVRWRAKVVLPCGVDAEAAAAFKSHGKPQHLHHLLRFVSARKDREGISCLGGVWDAEADGCGGETPGAPDEAALRRAAIRNVKFETGLDLSVCATWTRFLEVHYKRVDAAGDPYDEIVVVFVPSVADCLPSMEEWPEIWKASQVRTNAANEAKAAAAKELKRSEDEEAKSNSSKDALLSGSGVKPGGEAMQVDEGGAQLAGAPKSEAEDKPANDIKEGAKPTIQQEGSTKDQVEGEKKETKENVAKQEEAPSTPRVILNARNTKDHRLRTMSISLDGLLDYNEQDKDDSTFELSLFGETLHELLMTASVNTFQEFLLEMRSKKEEEDKLKTEADERSKANSLLRKSMEKSEPEKNDKADTATPPKAVKPEDATGGKADASATSKDDKETKEAKDAPKDAKETQEEKNAADEEAKPKLPNYPVLAAFQYMDKNLTGYIRTDDARQLLHMAGQFTPNRLVREMVSAAADKRSRNRGDRICYRPLVNMPDFE